MSITIVSPPPDPDAVKRFISERVAACERVAELEREATGPGGLSEARLSEWRRLRRFVDTPFAVQWYESGRA